jgi:threonine synthase
MVALEMNHSKIHTVFGNAVIQGFVPCADWRGTALKVSADDMLTEISRVGKAEGIFSRPEGAACVAALRRLVENRWIQSDDEVVIFNTTSGLKYLDVIRLEATQNVG